MCQEVGAKTILWFLLSYEAELDERKIVDWLERLEDETYKRVQGVYLETDGPSVWSAICNNPVIFRYEGGTVSRGSDVLFERQLVDRIVKARVPQEVREAWQSVVAT